MSDREKVINDLQMQIEELEERLAIVLDGQPEIVRCKDCKHGRLYAPNCVDCEYMELARDADWYCADGERR